MQTKLLEKNIYLNRGKLVIFEKRIYNELNFIYRLASFIKFKNYFLFKYFLIHNMFDVKNYLKLISHTYK